MEGGDGVLLAYACVRRKNGVWVVSEFGVSNEIVDSDEAEPALRSLFAQAVTQIISFMVKMDKHTQYIPKSEWVALPLSPCRQWGICPSLEEDASLSDSGWLLTSLGGDRLETTQATRWLTDNF